MLIDDIMGELDVKRRSGFLPLLERAHQSRGQVFMTATEENWPERDWSREVQKWAVREGKTSKQNQQAGLIELGHWSGVVSARSGV